MSDLGSLNDEFDDWLRENGNAEVPENFRAVLAWRLPLAARELRRFSTWREAVLVAGLFGGGAAVLLSAASASLTAIPWATGNLAAGAVLVQKLGAALGQSIGAQSPGIVLVLLGLASAGVAVLWRGVAAERFVGPAVTRPTS